MSYKKEDASAFNQSQVVISEDDVWDIIEFARSLSGYPGAITPQLLNERMKDVSLNPMAATWDYLNGVKWLNLLKMLPFKWKLAKSAILLKPSLGST